MKKLLFLVSLLIFISCEKVVVVDLPQAQSLIVVEGWLSDVTGDQPVRITQSNAFSENEPITLIENAQVLVQARTGEVYPYLYQSNGYYLAETPFEGTSGVEYRVRVVIDSIDIRSEWDRMPDTVSIGRLEIEAFQENDPEEPTQEITVFYPKITTRDPVEVENFYRWTFFKNEAIFREPESITIQNDRLFNGNLIPNNFRNFNYDANDSITVQLIAISQQSHSYLALLKSQITSLGTSVGTTPAVVNGNLFDTADEDKLVLGYFGTNAISQGSIIVP